MKTYTKAALTAATILATSPAYAADFIRYDISTLGIETVSTASPSVPRPTIVSSYKSYLYSIIVPLSGDAFRTTSEGSFYRSNVTNTFPTGNAIVSATNAITFEENPGFNPQFVFGSIKGTLCVDAGGKFVFPTGFQTNCGTIAYNVGTQFSSTIYNALVVDVKATEGFGVSTAGYGVLRPMALASLVPEVSSWVMMIAGFGMVAGAARYRRCADKVAYR